MKENQDIRPTLARIRVWIIVVTGLAFVFNFARPNMESNSTFLDAMKIEVPRGANRSISFTNGEAAYYYTPSHQTNHPEYAWFEGMNVAKNRVFGGYNLFADGQKLDNENSSVWVYPYKLLRRHVKGLSEELWMLDHKNVVEISLTGAKQTIGIELRGKNVHFLNQRDDIAFFSPQEGQFVIAVSSKNILPLRAESSTLYADAHEGGFYIAIGETDSEAASLIRDVQTERRELENERIHRIETFLLHNAYFSSDSDSLNLALNWLQTTMNQLVTHQQGFGIYAGLPWFNEYWGRDEFISFPGAILVTGQFETARKILKSFADYQQKDPASKYFGRVPNIVNPTTIDYHTTDGTPRFINQLQEYVRYSGDTSLIQELYPVVVNSIEGALQYWVDDKGYLLHEDNETWMDARDANLVSYSPRGNRANDIQSLWYHQLMAGADFAAFMKDIDHGNKWNRMADKVKSNFESDYHDAEHDFLADRLTPENKAEFTLRPNQLFALDMIDDRVFKCTVIRKVWQELVYPWGVATLDRHNPFFHPFHLTGDYPKDEAYHNGTVWLWLNGIAMQRMIEEEQVEIAYELFKNMNRQALSLGVVGGLGENMDAYPHPGETWPKLTGTYLQAWSNAEQLRVWYQYFLGIRPDLTKKALVIAPRIPDGIKKMDYHILMGNGFIVASYRVTPAKTYRYTFNELRLKATIDIFPFEIKQVDVTPNSELQLRQLKNELTISLLNKKGDVIKEIKALRSPLRIKENGPSERLLKGVMFAKPIDLKNHPVIKHP